MVSKLLSVWKFGNFPPRLFRKNFVKLTFSLKIWRKNVAVGGNFWNFPNVNSMKMRTLRRSRFFRQIDYFLNLDLISRKITAKLWFYSTFPIFGNGGKSLTVIMISWKNVKIRPKSSFFLIFYRPNLQGVPLPFHLFQTLISWRVFDLWQKFL